MGGSNAGRIPQTFDDLLRNIEKRSLRNDRRPNFTSAADFLGAGFAPYAVQTLDWSSAECSFNGFFYSPLGALNSPDTTKWWIGMTEGQVDGYGIQRVWEFHTTENPPRSYIRSFSSAVPGLRVYTGWKSTDGGPHGYVKAQDVATTITAAGGTSQLVSGFGTLVLDDGRWSYAAGVFTPLEAGRYLMIANLGFNATAASGQFHLSLRVNAAAAGQCTTQNPAGAWRGSTQAIRALVVGDDVDMVCRQTGDVSQDTLTGSSTQMQFIKMSD